MVTVKRALADYHSTRAAICFRAVFLLRLAARSFPEFYDISVWWQGCLLFGGVAP